MRLLLSLLMLLATVVIVPTDALPQSSVICDINRVKKHKVKTTTANTRVQVSSSSVAPGGTSSITLSNTGGGFGGFLLYVVDNGNTHVGTFGGQLATASTFCTNGAPAKTTLSHTSPALRPSATWQWTAPTTPGTYTVLALVAESSNGTPNLFEVPTVTITVAAAAVQPTQPPPPPQLPTQAPPTAAPIPNTPTTAPATTAPVIVIPPNPGMSNPTTSPVDVATPAPPTVISPATASPSAKDAYNMVLVLLQDVLAGGATVAQLRTAIQNLIAQVQAALQAAKAAKGDANANAKIKMIVTKAPGAAALGAAGTGSSSLNLGIGFADAADAVLFAGLVTSAASSDSTIRSHSTLLSSGDLASQIQPDPNGLDAATGQVMVTDAQQVATVTCSDGTIVSQDMQAVLCPNGAVAPAAAGGATVTTPAVPLSNGAFIGVIIAGILLLTGLVAGLMYYQKAKANKSTSVAPRV